MPGVMISQEIIGAQDFANNLERWAQAIESQPMREAYNRIVVKIRNDIRSNRVPVDTGFLRSTVYGEVVTWWPTAEMRFGATAPYASYVHETHKTRSGYITTAMEHHQDWVLKVLVLAVREVLGG